MNIIRNGFCFFGLVLLISCGTKKSEQDFDLIAYEAEINSWHQSRVYYLKSDNGWLNLAGLYWLKEGVNSFGSDESNDLVFPKDKIPAKAGLLLLRNGTVTLTVLPAVEIFSNEKIIKSEIVYHPDSTKQPTLAHGSLRWFIIKRDNLFGIRLRDLTHKTVQEFPGIEHYVVDPKFRVEATLDSSAAKKIDIVNVLGQTTAQDSPGTLVFQLDGKKFRLDALIEGDELFMLFGDPTNENETYPSGRYMYVKMPGADGKTILDFNKAFNPPCAFTPFATCPLPPSQNILDIAITAGEKNYIGYTH